MAITINGSGTISGITAGGLPDGVITADDLAAGVGGKVLQVVGNTYSTEVGTSSTSYVDTGLSASITPSSVSSKILVLTNIPMVASEEPGTDVQSLWQLLRNSTQLAEHTIGDHTGNGSRSTIWTTSTFSYLDSPSSTSSITYKVQMRVANAGWDVYAQAGSDTSSITLMEIAA